MESSYRARICLGGASGVLVDAVMFRIVTDGMFCCSLNLKSFYARCAGYIKGIG